MEPCEIDEAERLEIAARDARAAKMHRAEGGVLTSIKGMSDESVERILNATAAFYDLPLPFPERQGMSL